MSGRTIWLFTQQENTEIAVKAVSEFVDGMRGASFFNDTTVDLAAAKKYTFGADEAEREYLNKAWDGMLRAEKEHSIGIVKLVSGNVERGSMPFMQYVYGDGNDSGERREIGRETIRLMRIKAEEFCADMPYFNIDVGRYALPLQPEHGDFDWYVVPVYFEY